MSRGGGRQVGGRRPGTRVLAAGTIALAVGLRTLGAFVAAVVTDSPLADQPVVLVVAMWTVIAGAVGVRGGVRRRRMTR